MACCQESLKSASPCWQELGSCFQQPAWDGGVSREICTCSNALVVRFSWPLVHLSGVQAKARSDPAPRGIAYKEGLHLIIKPVALLRLNLQNADARRCAGLESSYTMACTW